MKQILLLSIIVLLSSSLAQSQIHRDTDKASVLNGVLHEKGTYNPVAGAKIIVRGTNVEIYADARGFFVIPQIKGAGNVWLEISADDFETLYMPATIGGVQELGIVFMALKQRDTNPINVNDLRAAGSDVKNSSFSEPGTAALLLGTGDVLVNAANYNMGALGFRLRGYEWRNMDVYFNGAPMTDIETGYANPQLWDGMNNAMGKNEGSYGLNSSLLYYGNIGGVSNIRIRPSEFRKRFKASYAFSNSLYNHRVMASYTTGQMDNGWSLLTNVSGRLGNGFAKGTKLEGISYLFIAEKEIAVDQTLMITVAGAPTKRGLQNYSSQEAYDIANDNFYNSAWGDDNGKKRNARTNKFHQPLISLSHNWDINDWTLLRTTAGFSFGNNSTTDLAWTTSAADPRPDTYDKLATDFVNGKQINWANIYDENLNSTQKQARYIIGAQHANRITASINSIYDNEISETLLTTAGIQGRYYQGSFYNEVDNLLGANFWVDVDKFSGTPQPNHEQNDMNHLNREARVGDRFAYDYNMSQMDFSLWNRWIMNWKGFDFTASASASYTSFWRNGNMKNGKYPDNSEGKSESQNFFNYSGKGTIAYPLFNGYIEGSGFYSTRAPLFRDAYLSPQISDVTTNTLKSETIWGAELNYLMAASFFNLRISGFYTQFNKQTRTRFYYDNDNQSLMNMSLTGLNQRHFGGELSADLKLLADLTLKAAASYGIYKYTSDPMATLTQQNTKDITHNDVVNMEGLYVAGTPQMAFTAGLLYDSPQRWWAGVNLNYAANNYAEVNPVRFTENNPEASQEKLKAAMTLDIHGGYTFEFSDKYYLGINLNAHNLLGNESPIGAYEPLTRFDTTTYPENKYAANYAYAYGRTIFLMISFRF